MPQLGALWQQTKEGRKTILLTSVCKQCWISKHWLFMYRGGGDDLAERKVKTESHLHWGISKTPCYIQLRQTCRHWRKVEPAGCKWGRTWFDMPQFSISGAHNLHLNIAWDHVSCRKPEMGNVINIQFNFAALSSDQLQFSCALRNSVLL